jgi:hypothetical protein
MISNSAVGVAGIKFEVRPRRQPEPQTQKDSGWLGNRRNAILRICFQPFGRVDPFSGSVTKADASRASRTFAKFPSKNPCSVLLSALGRVRLLHLLSEHARGWSKVA